VGQVLSIQVYVEVGSPFGQPGGAVIERMGIVMMRSGSRIGNGYWSVFLLNPIIALVYAYTGFRVEHVPPTESQTTTAEPTGAPPPSILVAEGDLHVQ